MLRMAQESILRPETAFGGPAVSLRSMLLLGVLAIRGFVFRGFSIPVFYNPHFAENLFILEMKSIYLNNYQLTFYEKRVAQSYRMYRA